MARISEWKIQRIIVPLLRRSLYHIKCEKYILYTWYFIFYIDALVIRIKMFTEDEAKVEF